MGQRRQILASEACQGRCYFVGTGCELRTWIENLCDSVEKTSDNCGVQAGWGRSGARKVAVNSRSWWAPKAGAPNSAGDGVNGRDGGAGRMGSCGQTMWVLQQWGLSRWWDYLGTKPKRFKGQAGKLHTNEICLLFVETVLSMSIGICEVGKSRSIKMYVMYDVCYLLSDIHRVVVMRCLLGP